MKWRILSRYLYIWHSFHWLIFFKCLRYFYRKPRNTCVLLFLLLHSSMFHTNKKGNMKNIWTNTQSLFKQRIMIIHISKDSQCNELFLGDPPRNIPEAGIFCASLIFQGVYFFTARLRRHALWFKFEKWLFRMAHT